MTLISQNMPMRIHVAGVQVDPWAVQIAKGGKGEGQDDHRAETILVAVTVKIAISAIAAMIVVIVVAAGIGITTGTQGKIAAVIAGMMTVAAIMHAMTMAPMICHSSTMEVLTMYPLSFSVTDLGEASDGAHLGYAGTCHQYPGISSNASTVGYALVAILRSVADEIERELEYNVDKDISR